MQSQENSRKKTGLVIAVAVIILLCSAGLYSQGPRATLRRALDLRVLPRSVRIVEHHTDIWTDYIFAASITLDPKDLETLLSERDFEKSNEPLFGLFFQALPTYQSFLAHEGWRWQAENNTRDEVLPPTCIIVTNESHTQAFIQCIAD